ncbi:DNA/RNA non-specific endonuclease [Shewanella sp. NKUCC06_TVS]|nr:DNA/RNA non-specific endonuclease [Shewanella sp. NKUCC06_TVS]
MVDGPLIHPSKTLEKDYYKGASSSALQADRGNQAPLATFASSKYWYELNYLSNITPQDEDLNQGPWKSLEDAEGAAVGFRNSLFVITGPLYLKEMPPMKPIRFRQLTSKLFITKMATAYIMEQSAKRNDIYCASSVLFETLKQKLNFPLPALHSSAALLKQLGCM